MKLFDSGYNNLWTKRPEAVKNSQKPRSKMLIFIPVVIVLILAYASDYIFHSNITMEMHTDYVVFRGGFMGEPIYYDEINNLMLSEERFELGNRISGVSTLCYHAGKFQGGSLDGVYDIYLQKDWQGPILILSHDHGILVVGSDSFDMKQLYVDLTRKKV